MASGITGTRYLERFGGYGKQRDLGLIQYQLMTVFDFLMAENTGAAKDSLALLIVMVEQACLDHGRFDLGQVLTLQEDPPAGVFRSRHLSQVSRARSFAPLADQRWITVALAFSERARHDHGEKDRAPINGLSFYRWRRSFNFGKGQRQRKSKEKKQGRRQRRRPATTRRGDVDLPGPSFALDTVDDTLDFVGWAICLPRWVLATRSIWLAPDEILFREVAWQAYALRCLSASRTLSRLL